jgi:hypothetical protein
MSEELSSNLCAMTPPNFRQQDNRIDGAVLAMTEHCRKSGSIGIQGDG